MTRIKVSGKYVTQGFSPALWREFISPKGLSYESLSPPLTEGLTV